MNSEGFFLKDCVNEVNDYLFDIKNSWKTYGCSIMADGWTNQRQEPIVNFLVFSPRGSMFLKSVDASGLTKDADTLFQMFDEIVQQISLITLCNSLQTMMLLTNVLGRNCSTSTTRSFGLLV